MFIILITCPLHLNLIAFSYPTYFQESRGLENSGTAGTVTMLWDRFLFSSQSSSYNGRLLGNAYVFVCFRGYE